LRNGRGLKESFEGQWFVAKERKNGYIRRNLGEIAPLVLWRTMRCCAGTSKTMRNGTEGVRIRGHQREREAGKWD